MIGPQTVFALFVLPLAFARVFNMTAPETAYPGQNITAVLYTENYIQNWNDFGVIWGLKSVNLTCAECLGQQISYNDLYDDPDFPRVWGNATFQVPIPDYTPPGEYTLVASVPYLVGASGETGFSVFNQSLGIGSIE